MIQTTIDRVDHKTDQEVAIPPDVLATVERADRILGEQLQSVEYLPLHASWCQFEQNPTDGWVVSLHISTDEYSFGQRLRVADLRNPGRAKDLIREVLWNFGRTLSDQVGERIRQIRADLKNFLAAGVGAD